MVNSKNNSFSNIQIAISVKTSFLLKQKKRLLGILNILQQSYELTQNSNLDKILYL